MLENFEDWLQVLKTPSPGPSKYDYVGKGHEKWRKKVDAAILSELTPQRIINWRAHCLRRAKQDPLSQEKARNTINSILRNSKALFSTSVTNVLPFKIEANPFEGVPVGSPTTRRYESNTDFKKLAEDAQKELFIRVPAIDPDNISESKKQQEEAISKNQQFKILLLGLGCGLRRKEIDNLLWENVNFKNRTISIKLTEYAGTKTATSNRIVDVDPTIFKLLRKYFRTETGAFVIQSKVKPKLNATYDHYRCNKHFKRLLKWLRQRGINRQNALHELRKEYGSRVCQEFGIYAASRALGHGDVRTTAASYLDKKEKTAISIL